MFYDAMVKSQIFLCGREISTVIESIDWNLVWPLTASIGNRKCVENRPDPGDLRYLYRYHITNTYSL